MLPYILAIAVASASFLLFLGAFVFPKLHRQDDFLWSGVGLFYALVLWLCAGRLTGGVLLGQAAATCLLLAFGWQTVKLRRAIAYPESQTDLEGFSVTRWLGSRFNKAPRKPATPKVATPVTETPEVKTTTQEEVVEAIAETTEEKPVAPAKSGFLSNIFGSRQSSAKAKPTSLSAALDEAEATADLATDEFEEDWEPEEIPPTTAITETTETVADADLATEEFEEDWKPEEIPLTTAITETTETVEPVADADLATEESEAEANAITEIVEPVEEAAKQSEVVIKQVSDEAETNAPTTVEDSPTENTERAKSE